MILKESMFLLSNKFTNDPMPLVTNIIHLTEAQFVWVFYLYVLRYEIAEITLFFNKARAFNSLHVINMAACWILVVVLPPPTNQREFMAYGSNFLLTIAQSIFSWPGWGS